MIHPPTTGFMSVHLPHEWASETEKFQVRANSLSVGDASGYVTLVISTTGLDTTLFIHSKEQVLELADGLAELLTAFTVQEEKDNKRNLTDLLATEMKTLIVEDFSFEGLRDRKIRAFTDLHDHADANEYLIAACRAAGRGDLMKQIGVTCELDDAIDLVDEWLKKTADSSEAS